jgi:hypothetical protein
LTAGDAPPNLSVGGDTVASKQAGLAQIRRFRGELLWLDLRLQRDPISFETLKRAILRPGCLALEFERDGRQYGVTSKRVPIRSSAARGKRGGMLVGGRLTRAGGPNADSSRLAPIWTKSVHSDGVDFLGTWYEDDLDWRWAGQLIPVEDAEVENRDS